MTTIDTDALRAECDALPDGAHRDAALNHLAAGLIHLHVTRTWIDASHEAVRVAEQQAADEARRQAEMARLAEEQAAREAELARIAEDAATREAEAQEAHGA